MQPTMDPLLGQHRTTGAGHSPYIQVQCVHSDNHTPAKRLSRILSTMGPGAAHREAHRAYLVAAHDADDSARPPTTPTCPRLGYYWGGPMSGPCDGQLRHAALSEGPKAAPWLVGVEHEGSWTAGLSAATGFTTTSVWTSPDRLDANVRSSIAEIRSRRWDFVNDERFLTR